MSGATTIENHPVWPFEPNWTSSVGESLEWLTDVLMSPTGSEQRRSMRYFPRRVLDFTIAAEGPERSLLDNLMMSYAARDWYLPLWHDVTVTTAQSTTASIPCIPSAGIEPGTVIFIAGDTVYDYQIAEVSFVGASSINLVAPLSRAIPIGSRIFPMTVGRLTEMPQITAMTDSLVTAEPQFLVTEKPKDPGVDIRDAGPLIMNGLIVNAYHQETGRGGYFHHNSGTSEGQFIFIYSLFLAYEQLIGGNAEHQGTALYYKSLAQQMLDAMGSGNSYLGPMLRQPIPSDVDTITLLHWLFAARGDIPGQEVVLAYEVPRVGNTLTVPASAGGGSAFKVWQIYPGSSALLYDSPHSPAFDMSAPTVETQVLIDEGNWARIGDTLVITIPSGSPAHATWKVVFGYNTSTLIPQGNAFEAYPNWTAIEPGYSACAPDTFRWFEQAMQKAIEHDDRAGKAARWTALQLAMRRTAVRGQSITDLREVFRPMPGFDAIPVKGAPDGMYCYSDHPDAKGPNVIGANAGWLGFDWWSRNNAGALVGSVPTTPVREPVVLEPGVKASFTFGDMTPSYFYVNRTLLIDGRSYPIIPNHESNSWETIASRVTASDPDVTARQWKTTVGTGDNRETLFHLTITAREDSAAMNGKVVNIVGVRSGVLAGGEYPIYDTATLQPYQVQIGRGFADSWRTAQTYQAADQYLYVKVGCSRKPDPAKNERFLIYVSGSMAYREDIRWYADIGSLPAFVATTGTIEFFIHRTSFRLRSWDAAGDTVWGAPLPVGTEILNFGVSSEYVGPAYSVRLSDMRLVSDNTAEAVKGSKMPFFPGSMPFAINADLRRQMLVGWNGSPFHGYQLADFWWWLQGDAAAVHPTLTVADLPIPNSSGGLTFPITPTVGGVAKPRHALLMEQQLFFLQQAQAKYAADGGPNGFFAHTFVLNTPARASLGNPTPHTWVYVNDDPNTRWVGYQTRIVESLAELLLLAKDSPGFATCRSMALSMAEAWLTRLNVLWPNLNGKLVGGVRIYGMPTDYPDPRISAPLTLYEEPHAAAHILRACLTLKKAGFGNTALHNALISRCWNYMEMLWRTEGEMRFTWSPDPAKKQWYGFWHGDIITALSLMMENPSLLPGDVPVAIVTQRLVETREWIENWGVGRLQPNAEAGLVEEYDGFHVLTLESDWSDRLDRGQQRLLDTIESATGMPEQVDTARRPFPTQRHQWVLEGAGDHAQFYALAQVLRGRATPVWVPTWMDDMRLAAPTTISGSTVTVARCGFTLAGGPRPEREHIMIETVDGRHIYRRITNSAVAGINETLLLSAPIGEVLSPSNVLRICFMSLMRLDHDSIEIDHKTDIEGVSEVQVTFRAAPNTRVAEAAFYD